MLSNLEKEINNICNTDYKFFFSKPNVQGIGLGYKYKNGINTCEKCIHVLVDKKISANCLPSNGLIPSCYKGIKTDVIETGKFTTTDSTDTLNFASSPFLNANARSYTNRIRPIKPSYCMSVASSTTFFPYAGTFGYIVIDNLQTSTTYCLLSVNKTFADFNGSPLGTPIVQPAYSYGGRDPKDTVAKLLRFSTINFNESMPNSLNDFNVVDASVASYLNVGQVQLIDPFIPEIGIPTGITTAKLNDNIQWTGAFVGYEKGTITSLGATIKLSYQNGKTAWFKDVIIGSGISYALDFGSLICDESLKALGLLFGTAPNNVICICNITTVLQTLNLTLLTA